ncbi:MAG: ABC transporter ATP-binding protein [Clostridia bacterium]|nr:ABC transporter ATP-binding protein [Clostridia bacterium]
MMGPPPGNGTDKLREPKPKSVREVPGYVWRIVSKFTYRLFYIFRLVWETRPWILFLMMFTAIVNGVLPVIAAKISAALIDELATAWQTAQAGGKVAGGVVTLLIVQAVYQVVSGVIGQVSSTLSSIAGELVVNHVNVKIMKKAMEIDLADYDTPDFYEKLENASREAGHRPIQILQASFNIVSRLISIITFVVILWAVSPFAPFVMAAFAIPSAVITFIYRKKNFNYMRHRSKDRRQLNYYSSLMTNKDLAKEVKIFNLGGTFIDRYRSVFAKYFSGLKKLFVAEGVWQTLTSIASTCVMTLLYVFIASGVSGGKYSVGDFSLYSGALISVASGVSALIGIFASIYEGTLFIDNLIVFMERKRTVVPVSDGQPRRLTRHVAHRFELKDVSFSYPGSSKRVIDHVNLVIEEGSTVVLVGLNGAGKTTLIKLLTRLYDPTEGVILLDGYDIREYEVGDVYSAFGIIFQDFGKYAVSVRENIVFGQISRPFDEENVTEAARRSNSEGFISALPGGYDTPLMKYFETDGIELSIGQWQKLSIARAFYSDTDILILDEPTASLDAIAEQEIYRQFDELRRDRTTIFVSHRLSSATTADKIVVLENGKVVEIGTHAELMAAKKQYYELFSAQAERYIASAEEIRDHAGKQES